MLTNACGAAKLDIQCALRLARRFEQLALGYDEDDIGSLADDDLDVAGDTAIDDFEYAMEDFLASEPGASAAFQQLRGPGTRGLQYRTAAEDAGARDPETSAAAAATLARVMTPVLG